MKWIKTDLVGLEYWHRWFAWIPVKIKTFPDGAETWAWLETVERCISFADYGILTSHPEITKYREATK